MPPVSWAQAGIQYQRDKLANSYQELLDEFNSHDLQSVGNYSVGRLIGKGSFGKVYLASHKLTNGSKVVLKSAKKEDPNLAREIHHHRQFVHPHIARLYEVIVTESLVWLVLEYCPGDELYNHLLDHGAIEESQVQKIFTQLVGAVSYVHNKGCVHRDLKLENILLDKSGNVKLVDFGFTRDYQGSTSYLQTWCGTVCYSAPEMIKGEKYAGEKVDVWSLGIILFALLRGELPFDDDNEAITKARILKEEPDYKPDFPAGAKDLCSKLLSKRPLPRPSLPDILRHPWLSDHAPQQQETLKLQQPPPFSTQLEKETLQRMRSAGVDIDMVIEHVLAQRCDSLAGWWALLIEKEERKAKRRERKRKEKEAEEKRLRRLSAASGRLLSAPMRGINEEEHTVLLANPPKPRGRKASRSNASSLPPVTPDLGQIQEHRVPTPEMAPPRSMEKDPARSTSSTRRRPAPPPKEFDKRPRAVSRHSSSMLRNVHTNPTPTQTPTQVQQRKKLYQQPLRAQLTRIKSWFIDMPKRTKSPGLPKNVGDFPSSSASPDPNNPQQDLRRSMTAEAMGSRKTTPSSAITNQNHRPDIPSRATYPARPRLSTASSYGSTTSNSMTRSQAKRLSLSPQPLTPRSSSFRRRSGLGGRKSTSSSVSSVRSIAGPHHPSGTISHSKASSTSSASASVVASPNPSNAGGGGGKHGAAASSSRSPSSAHGSVGNVKVLPATPTNGSFPASIRVQRRGPPGNLVLPNFADLSLQPGSAAGNGGGGGGGGGRGGGALAGAMRNASPFGGPIGPPSPGMHAVFARGKRKVFKGPTGLGNSPRNMSRVATPSGSQSREGSTNRGSMERSKGVITEEDEEEEEEIEVKLQGHGIPDLVVENGDVSELSHALAEEDEEEGEEEIEEVDAFSPVLEGFHEDGGGYFVSVHQADAAPDELAEHMHKEEDNGVATEAKVIEHAVPKLQPSPVIHERPWKEELVEEEQEEYNGHLHSQ